MRIISAHPTIFLKRIADKLQRRIEATLEFSPLFSPQSETIALEVVDGAGADTKAANVSPGRTTIPVPRTSPSDGRIHVSFDVPELDFERVVEVTLRDGERVLETANVTIRPAKRWVVHVVQLSHHDAGYTDLPSRVFDDHRRWLSDALDYAEETRSYPDAARFRMVVEQAWSLRLFLERCTDEQRNKMISYLRSGDFELTALFGNMITELCGHEELVRMLYSSSELARRFGFRIVSAEHNDIPGFAWGLSRVLTDSGIRIFCPGLPRYYDWSRDDYHLQSFWDDAAIFDHEGPGAFWWRSPNGKRILFWCNNSGCGGDCRPGLPGLAPRLEELTDSDYPYSIIRWPVSGGARDNSPYSPDYADTIRRWNEQWAYPRLISSTNARFYADFIRDIPADLPEFHGELPGQDYPVGATSTARSTAVNRVTHTALPQAEAVSAAAQIRLGSRYPEAEIRQAWDDLMWYDEHTWGLHFPAGAASEAAFAEKQIHAYRAAALAHDIFVKAAAAISDAIRLPEAESTGDGEHGRDPIYLLTVFSLSGLSTPQPVRVPLRSFDNCGSTMHFVTAEEDQKAEGYYRGVILNHRWNVNVPAGFLAGSFTLTDIQTGANVDYEIEAIDDPETPVPFAAERAGLGSGGKRYGMFEDPAGIKLDLVFAAAGIPAPGYTTYRLAATRGERAERGTALSAEATFETPMIENEFYRIEADRDTGSIRSIVDKETGEELVDPRCPHSFGEIIVREPGTMESPRVIHRAASSRLSRAHSGRVFSCIESSSTIHGHPTVRHRVSLYRGVKAVYFDVRLLKDTTPLLDAYLAFPFRVDRPKFRYQGSLSGVDAVADFFPGAFSDTIAVQEWVKVSNDEKSVLWTSLDAPVASFGDLQPGYVSPAHRCRIDGSAAHAPLSLEDFTHGWIYSAITNNNFGTNFAVSQCGSLLFRYVFGRFAADVSDAEATLFGTAAAAPLQGMLSERNTDAQSGDVGYSGSLPPDGALIEIAPPEILMLAWKRKEEDDGFVVRLWNQSSIAVEATLSFPSIEIVAAWLCDLTEQSISELTVTDSTSLSVAIGSDDIATIKFVVTTAPAGPANRVS